MNQLFEWEHKKSSNVSQSLGAGKQIPDGGLFRFDSAFGFGAFLVYHRQVVLIHGTGVSQKLLVALQYPHVGFIDHGQIQIQHSEDIDLKKSEM